MLHSLYLYCSLDNVRHNLLGIEKKEILLFHVCSFEDNRYIPHWMHLLFSAKNRKWTRESWRSKSFNFHSEYSLWGNWLSEKCSWGSSIPASVFEHCQTARTAPLQSFVSNPERIRIKCGFKPRRCPFSLIHESCACWFTFDRIVSSPSFVTKKIEPSTLHQTFTSLFDKSSAELPMCKPA